MDAQPRQERPVRGQAGDAPCPGAARLGAEALPPECRNPDIQERRPFRSFRVFGKYLHGQHCGAAAGSTPPAVGAPSPADGPLPGHLLPYPTLQQGELPELQGAPAPPATPMG